MARLGIAKAKFVNSVRLGRECRARKTGNISVGEHLRPVVSYMIPSQEEKRNRVDMFFQIAKFFPESQNGLNMTFLRFRFFGIAK